MYSRTDGMNHIVWECSPGFISLVKLIIEVWVLMWSLTLSFPTGLRFPQLEWLILRAWNRCWLLIVLSFLLRIATTKWLLLCGFFLHACDKIRDTNNLKGARLILFTVSKVSPHGGSHIRRIKVGLIQTRSAIQRHISSDPCVPCPHNSQYPPPNIIFSFCKHPWFKPLVRFNSLKKCTHRLTQRNAL